MEITVKKIKASRSIIDQIQTANVEAILNQEQILGWCQWTFGSGKTKTKKKLIIFTDDKNRPFKIVMPEAIILSDYDRYNQQERPEYRMKEPWIVTIKRGSFTEDVLKFKTKEDQNEFYNLLQRLKRVALEQGQFFI